MRSAGVRSQWEGCKHHASLPYCSALAAACSTGPAKSPDIAAHMRSDLERRGLHDVSVAQDRDTGVVTLSGKVPSEDEKSAAASIAQAAAPARSSPIRSSSHRQGWNATPQRFTLR